jgi:hypothetical protein
MARLSGLRTRAFQGGERAGLHQGRYRVAEFNVGERVGAPAVMGQWGERSFKLAAARPIMPATSCGARWREVSPTEPSTRSARPACLGVARALAGGRIAYSLNGTTLDFCSPSPAIRSVITSPGTSHFGGFMPSATPGGVPVVTTSPGSSTMN